MKEEEEEEKEEKEVKNVRYRREVKKLRYQKKIINTIDISVCSGFGESFAVIVTVTGVLAVVQGVVSAIVSSWIIGARIVRAWVVRTWIVSSRVSGGVWRCGYGRVVAVRVVRAGLGADTSGKLVSRYAAGEWTVPCCQGGGESTS